MSVRAARRAASTQELILAIRPPLSIEAVGDGCPDVPTHRDRGATGPFPPPRPTHPPFSSADPLKLEGQYGVPSVLKKVAEFDVIFMACDTPDVSERDLGVGVSLAPR